MTLKNSNSNMLPTNISLLANKIITGLEKTLKLNMNKINTQIVFMVLTVHVIILLLIWGGISTIGAAIVLLIFLIGGTFYFSSQKGKQYRTNTRKIASGEFNCNVYLPFRG